MRMNTNIKKFLPYAFVGVISGATAIGGIKLTENKPLITDAEYFSKSSSNVKFAGLNSAAIGDDFVKAASRSVPAVVTIKSYTKSRGRNMQEQDLFDLFFGQGARPQQNESQENVASGLGSGVIISSDGYIISNNHVIAGASKLEVVLSNKKSYTATVVGSDPTTDIALLKIEENNLPFLSFANSDNVEVGQWVLAVGNPLGLNSTVTAGIISAKGRNINILRNQSRTPIESFIQTDAAINRGNSGGALVNTNGDLIGINSAISSNTGYYEGYGFAVPSNLARKVIEDIKKFGLVQRAYLGVSSLDLSDSDVIAEFEKKTGKKITQRNGVMVMEVQSGSAAADLGLKEGDYITKVDNQLIGSASDLSFSIGSKRPGDRVSITYTRNGVEKTELVTLKDQRGKTSARTKEELSVMEKLGAEIAPLSESFKANYGLDYGVVTTKVDEGSILSQAGIEENFIILEVNGKRVSTQADFEKILNNYKGNVSLKYVDSNGRMYTRGFKL